MPETLEQMRERVTAAVKLQQELAVKVQTLSTSLEEAKTAKIRAEAQNEQISRQLNNQTVELNQLRKNLSQAQENLQKKEREIGQLQVVAQNAQKLQIEKDKSLQELAQLKADLENRIGVEVKSALERSSKEQEVAAAKWEKERKDMLAETANLKERLGKKGIRDYVFPTDLGTKLAKVVEDLAEGKADKKREYTVALTAMEVEARGLLEAPREGEDQPRFVTAETGKIDPAALSTLRMSFKVLPRIVPPES